MCNPGTENFNSASNRLYFCLSFSPLAEGVFQFRATGQHPPGKAPSGFDRLRRVTARTAQQHRLVAPRLKDARHRIVAAHVNLAVVRQEVISNRLQARDGVFIAVGNRFETLPLVITSGPAQRASSR